MEGMVMVRLRPFFGVGVLRPATSTNTFAEALPPMDAAMNEFASKPRPSHTGLVSSVGERGGYPPSFPTPATEWMVKVKAVLEH